MNNYNVIFLGEVVEGFTKEQVSKSLATALKITDEKKAEQLVSGKKITLKKSVSRDIADTYIQKLQKIGASCQLEEIEPQGLSLEPVAEFEEDIVADVNSKSADEGLSMVPMDKPQLSLEPTEQSSPVRNGSKAVFEAKDVPSFADEALARSNNSASNTASSHSSSHSYAAYKSVGNSSGQGAASTIPDNVRGWCWGGFFLNWIWAIRFKTWIGLLALLPFIGFPMMIVLGIKGKEWAWRNTSWESVDEFNESQKRWGIAGAILTVLGMIFWFNLASDVADINEDTIQQLEAQQQEFQERLDEIEDPEQRRQMEVLLEFQEQLKNELEKQQ